MFTEERPIQRAAGMDRQHGWVQWDLRHVRYSAKTGELLRGHLPQSRGKHQIRDEDRPKHTPPGTQYLLIRAGRAGSRIGTLCRKMHDEQGQVAVREFKVCWRWPRSTVR